MSLIKRCQNCGGLILGPYRKVSDRWEDDKLVGVYEHLNCKSDPQRHGKIETHHSTGKQGRD